MKKKLFCDEHTIDFHYQGQKEVEVRIWKNKAEDYHVLEIRNYLQANPNIYNLANNSMTLDQAFEALLDEFPEDLEIHALQVRVKPNGHENVWLGRVGYTVDF